MAGKAGRPAGNSDARERLISEARKLFIALPYGKVSTRMLASRAGVNVAMIRYYFGNKAGLFETMLRETVEPMLEQLKIVINRGDIDSLGELMRTYYRVMAPTPEFPKLMIRIMMMEPSDIQRQLLEKIFQDVIGSAGEIMFDKMKEKGALREDVDPKKARMTFISLMVFPFLIPPSILEIHGFQLDEAFLMDLADHNMKVLAQGIQAPTKEGTA